MTVKIMACEVMKEALLAIKPEQPVEYEFVSMGLHRYPQKLRRELQHLLDRSWGYTKVILSFGLCGGAAGGLKAPDSPLIMPKVHDCIPLLLGAKPIYERCVNEEKGTFYLSKGWMITEQNILAEHRRIVEKHGVRKAMGVLARMFDGYKRVLFIRTGLPQEDFSLAQSRRIAALLQLTHHTIQGDDAYLRKIVNGPWDEVDFVHTAPFASVNEDLFNIFTEREKTGEVNQATIRHTAK